MATVWVNGEMSLYAAGMLGIDVEATTVREALDACIDRYPQLSGKIEWRTILLEGKVVDDLDTEISPNSSVRVL